jgi:hypothetical protein
MSDYWEGNSDYEFDRCLKEELKEITMAKKYYNLGSMKTKKEKDADGNVQYYIELDKELVGKLKIDGKPLAKSNDGKVYIQVERPTAKFDRMLASGKISDTEYNDKTERFSKDGDLSFVKFDLQAVTED